MTVGKAIFYLLNNYSNLTDIVGTRIYPEVAEQDGASPFVVYTIISNSPSDTHSGPSQLDVAQVDVVAYSTSYAECIDIGVHVRAALDRVTGTYNGVNVQSCQYTTELIDFDDYRRSYVITQSYDVRISRTIFDIASSTPITGVYLGQLTDVTDNATTGQVIKKQADGTWAAGDDASAASLPELTDVNIEVTANALDRQALVYDEATGEWINDGVGQTVIPIRNNSQTQILKGRIVAFAGTQGDRILVDTWDNASPSAYIVGVVDSLIAGGADGHAFTYGEIRDIDTSAWSLNTVLYAGTSGTFTTTPNSMPIATVTRVHENTGRIFVRTYVPGDHYRDRFRAEAHAAATAGTAVETYYTAQANGDGFYQSPGSDEARDPVTDLVRRTLYWKSGAFEAASAAGYSNITEYDEITYTQLLGHIDDVLNSNSAPITIWSKREEAPRFEGILDTYTNAAMAISLRLLSSTYSGAAIRVRRSSDNTEQDIGFTAGGDLDVQALATFCGSSDGFVRWWYDQSGNGRNFGRSNTNDQGKIYDGTTGVILQNSKPAISHAGNFVHYLQCGGQSTADFHTNNNIAYSAVVGSATTSYYTGYFQLSSQLDIYPRWASGTRHQTPTTIGLGTSSTGQFHHLSYRDNNSVVIRHNASNIVGGTDTANIITYTGITANLLAGFGSLMQEIIIFNTAMSSSATGVETNVNDYYSIYP